MVGFGGAGGATRILDTLRCGCGVIVAYTSFAGFDAVGCTSMAAG